MKTSNHEDDTPTTGNTDITVNSASGIQVGDRGDQRNFYGGIHHHYALSAFSWPVLSGRAPPQPAAFQRRSAIRRAIRKHRGHGNTATTTHVLCGEGGAGKTQLAAAIFRDALKEGVDLAAWVTAASRTSILAAYHEIYIALNPGADTASADGERIAERLLAWLAATERPWIFVLDDIADPADLHSLWPAGPAGKVLVTTRRNDAAFRTHGVITTIPVFTAHESLDYLVARLAGPGLSPAVLTEAASLATDLGYLPLALAHAASFIIDQAISCATYRGLLADRHRKLHEVFPVSPAAAGDDYGNAMPAAWSLALDRADAMPPEGLARPFLELIACMDPNGVAESVAMSLAARKYLSERISASAVSAPVAVPVAVPDARRTLRNLHLLSLIIHDADDEVRAIRMHALAQRAVLDQLTSPDLAVAVRAGADSLVEAWPDTAHGRQFAEVLRSNAAALSARRSEALWDPRAHQVLFRAGLSMGEVGLAAAAREYFTEFSQATAERLGCEHPQTLAARHDLAWWRGAAGHAVGAATALAQVLADQLRVLGPADPRTMATRTSLAYWQGEAGDPSRATVAFRELLSDQLRILGPTDPQTLATRINIAYWQGEAGDPAGAAHATQQLLPEIVSALGPVHPDTLATRNNLAYWRGHTGDKAGAAAATADLLSELILVLGEEHPDSLAARNSLAWWQGEAGDPQGAVNACRALLVTMRAVLGDDHIDTLATRNTLAWYQGEAGDGSGAVCAFEELLAARQRALGPDHLHTLYTRQNLGFWQGQSGQPEKAASTYCELLADCLRVLGASHPFTIATWKNLAFWERQAGLTAGSVVARLRVDPALAAPVIALTINYPDIPQQPAHWQKRPRPKLFGLSLIPE
jgi:NB-ARC domain/Tetratricopeptide repeat